MRTAVLTNFPIKSWVVYLYKHNLLDGSAKVLSLPPHYAEVVQCDGVASGGIVTIYGRWSIKCYLNLSLNALADSPMYSSFQFNSLHLYQWKIPLPCSMGDARMFLVFCCLSSRFGHHTYCKCFWNIPLVPCITGMNIYPMNPLFLLLCL